MSSSSRTTCVCRNNIFLCVCSRIGSVEEERILKAKRPQKEELFDQATRQSEGEQPLAARMRPRSLDEFVGQEHILGHGRLLRRAIQADQLSSLIFYGPPGTGKTTLARVIANTTRSQFLSINAVLAGVKEIRQGTGEAEERRKLYGQRTILFVDEVHRWNKAQQDALLPWVENGTIVFIGATTLNPFFEVNPALVSRSRIFQLKPLRSEDLYAIAERTLRDKERGYGAYKVEFDSEALDHLVDVSGGDARTLLNAIELAVETTPERFPPPEGETIRITLEIAEESIQRRVVLYDKEGDYHFDTISAFIKSLRGSDADAALYWLARMVYAGEDPRFIFRRMLIFASEDVGLADPNALVVIQAAAAAFERVGLPEGRFHLAQAVLYLATAPKSNTSMAFFDALEVVEREQAGEVPNHLRDSSRDKEGFGHGEGYLYPHAYREHWVAQQYLPDSLQGKVFYQPSDQGYEAAIQEQVFRRREAQLEAMMEVDRGTAEVLTFSKRDRARDLWLERAVSRASEQLSMIRETIFSTMSPARHHLLLDLSAGEGLLTWEALRRVPEGGVWSLCKDPSAASFLQSRAQFLSELERPRILIGNPGELPELLTRSGEEEVRFDAAVGRNALYREADKAGCLTALAVVLRSEGIVSLAEVVPSEGMRLSALLDLQTEDEAFLGKLAKAEQAVYTDADNPLVNWSVEHFCGIVENAGLSIMKRDIQRFGDRRTIRPEDIERWFAPQDGSYAARVSAFLSPSELQHLRRICEDQLSGREVAWHSTVLFLTARKAE
ncbi:MAG: AAA family ATPase [Spirochaetaceae bacterium]|nr:MAG: AAA family ATPase [Spirochaetaceae bacterium]